MIKVLFICHGNICRSPLAEYLLKDKIKKLHLEKRLYAESAAAHTDEIGNPIYPPVKKLLDAHGIDASKHRARLVKKSDYATFDYIICMDDANVRDLRWMFKNDPEEKIYKLLTFEQKAGAETGKQDKSVLPSDSRYVPDVDDPWYTREFTRCYDEIDAGLDAFIKWLGF